MNKDIAREIAAEAADRIALDRHEGREPSDADLQFAHQTKHDALALGATVEEIQAARSH